MDPQQCPPRYDGVRVCRACGFAYELSPHEVCDRLGGAATVLRSTVAAIEPERLDLLPAPSVWTPREYLAHLADWAEITADRIERILHEDGPILESYDQDRLAAERAYSTWDISSSLNRYARGVDRARRAIGEAGEDGWQQVGVRSDIGEVPLRHFANDLVHELEHHLLDIERLSARP